MGFRNFRVNIIIRILILGLAITACAWFIVQSEFIRAAYLGVLIIGLGIEFFYYSDKLNRDLNQFLISIIHDDYTSRFKDRGRGKSFRQLYETLDLVTRKFKSLSKEKETRNQYLFSLIDQVSVGIISFEKEGRINLVNKAFNEMLDTASLRIGVDLKQHEPGLYAILEMIAPGDRQLIKRKVRDEEREFSFVSTGFKMENLFFNLVSVQDIREELNNREHEAWQKLMRVLTHEIMNSVTPIASLTGSLHDLLINPGSRLTEKKLNEKLFTGLGAIEDRSRGLIKFTESYQRLSRIPLPVIKEINSASFLEKISVLFRAEFEASGILFIISSESAPENFHADKDLFEQVIINLLKNASDAVSGRDQAEIRLDMNARPDGKLSVIVNDNGKGIADDQLDRIFVPFYSTKESGSGIGLSLSRQIILMHKGTLTVSSRENEGSSFEIII